MQATGREAAAGAAPAAAAAAEAAEPLQQQQQDGGSSGMFQHSGSPGSSAGGGGSNALLDTPPPAPCSRAEQNVLSPTPSPSAAGPPATSASAGCTARLGGPHAAHAAATALAQQAAGGSKARLSPRAAELQRQVVELIQLHSFVRCLASSTVLPSALLLLEIADAHPPVAGGQAGPAGLEWTLAQLLALFMRTGEKAATEGMLLAALWVLESAHDGRRSGASHVLARYLKLVGVFFPETALLLRSNWPATFDTMRAQLVECQMRLLTCLRWRVHLTHETDVEPCHRLLFAGESTPAAEIRKQADGSHPEAAAARKPADGSRPAAVEALQPASSSRAVAAARQLAAEHQLAAASGTPKGMAGSRRGPPTLDDLEVLLCSNRASLHASVHSMVGTLKEQAALLRRALLRQAAKRGLRLPCGAEPTANAKRRRLE